MSYVIRTLVHNDQEINGKQTKWDAIRYEAPAEYKGLAELAAQWGCRNYKPAKSRHNSTESHILEISTRASKLIAAIDADLKGLGIVINEPKQAAPVKPAPVTVSEPTPAPAPAPAPVKLPTMAAIRKLADQQGITIPFGTTKQAAWDLVRDAAEPTATAAATATVATAVAVAEPAATNADARMSVIEDQLANITAALAALAAK